LKRGGKLVFFSKNGSMAAEQIARLAEEEKRLAKRGKRMAASVSLKIRIRFQGKRVPVTDKTGTGGRERRRLTQDEELRLTRGDRRGPVTLPRAWRRETEPEGRMLDGGREVSLVLPQQKKKGILKKERSRVVQKDWRERTERQETRDKIRKERRRGEKALALKERGKRGRSQPIIQRRTEVKGRELRRRKINCPLEHAHAFN